MATAALQGGAHRIFRDGRHANNVFRVIWGAQLQMFDGSILQEHGNEQRASSQRQQQNSRSRIVAVV